MPLYQHYFPADGERSFGEEWGKDWGGTVEGDGAMGVRVMRLRAIRLRVGQTKRELRRFLFKAL